MAFTPGATIADFKGGVVAKEIAGDTYIEAYVTDDGTNSYLCLDKIVADVRASMLGTIVGGAGTVTAITTPTAYQSDLVSSLPAVSPTEPGSQFVASSVRTW
jgi:hypothetical protein